METVTEVVKNMVGGDAEDAVGGQGIHCVCQCGNGVKKIVKNNRFKCILGITANEKRCRELLDASVGITTALCPYIGYKKAASLAKESLKTDIPVKTLVLKYGLLKENELDSILDPYAMTEARTRQTQAKAV